ncbi:MAG: (d)CMP kinase [Myxococcota bacterium]
MSFIVAIDGPAGAGKSTVARRVAAQLGFERVDTGAIYRSVTLAAKRAGLKEEGDIVAHLTGMDLRFKGETVWLDGQDVTTEIRTPEISAEVSRVAAMPGVRAQLLDLQRKLGQACDKGAVLEGRDIGTVVFPKADAKFFLTASARERARRRVMDLKAAGETADVEEVLAAIERRDAIDSARETAPLRRPEDAMVIDTDHRTEEEVVAYLTGLIQERLARSDRPKNSVGPSTAPHSEQRRAADY